MCIKQELLKIVGPEHFSDAPEVLDTYSKDFSLLPSGVPNYVVKPKDARQVQEGIKFANERLIPVVPVSSGVHFHGATIPKQSGIVLDLTGMNQILEVDDFNRRVRVEVGVTWANLKIEYLPKMDRVLFAPIPDLNYAINFLYRVLRLRIIQECLLLNNIDLAAIIARDLPQDFEKLRASLPPWTLILVISGMHRRPEEQLHYQEEMLYGVVKNEFPKISLADSLPGSPGLGKELLSLLRQPWPEKVTYWKNRYKGACQSLFFITKPVLAPRFIPLYLTGPAYGPNYHKWLLVVKDEFDPNFVCHPPVPLAHDQFVERAEWMKPMKDWESPEIKP